MTDQTAADIPVWQDGDPLMEAIAAAVYERCEVQHGSGIVIDDPRNIAAAAVAGVRDAARQATGQPDAEGTPCTCLDGPEEDAGQLLHASYCVATGAHTCPDGEPCPSHDQPAVEQPAEARPARNDLYDALDQSWYRWGRPDKTKADSLNRLIDAYRDEAATDIGRDALRDGLRPFLARLVGEPNAQGLLDAYRAEILREAADAEAEAERQMAAVERVRHVLEMEPVLNRTALEYRGLVQSALMADEAER